MIRLRAAIRSLVYGAGFVLLWGWIALQVDRMAGGALPALRATARPAPFAVFAHLFVMLYEERTPERRFGATYTAYRALVNRWLPQRPGGTP
jgi:protein-S-isoprenylcysteine O-methyltransferase Ste14